MTKYFSKPQLTIILSDIKKGGGAEVQVKMLYDLLNEKNTKKFKVELFLLSNKYKFTNKPLKLIFISFSIIYLLLKIIFNKYIRGFEIYLVTFTIIPNILGRLLKKAKLINKLITSIRNQTFASKQVNKILKNTFLIDDYTIYNSKESLRKCIQQKFSRKSNSFVVYNLRDKGNLQEIKIFNKTDYLSFGYVGRFESQKGIDLLIEAIKLLNISRNYKVEFNFYGEGSLLNYLISQQKIINSKSTNLNLKIHGWSNAPFDKEFKYLIIPSKWEGFPNVLIEGIQSKKIIIANKVGGIKDFSDFYKTKFIKLINSPNELSKLIMDCIQLSQQQELEIIKNQEQGLLNFYQDNEVKCWKEFI